MLCVGVNPQSFSPAVKNRGDTDFHGYETAFNRLCDALQQANALQKGDERILGNGDFVEAVLSEANEAYERKYRLKAKGVDVETLARRAAQIAGIEGSRIWSSGKQPKVVYARSLMCYWATSALGVSQACLSKRLRLSQPAISLSVARGRRIAAENNYDIEKIIN